MLAKLHLQIPVIQAPMAGGGDTPALVAAVSEAGGAGCIGAAYLSSAQIYDAAGEVRRKTSRAFGINLFAPVPEEAGGSDAEAAVQRVAPFYEQLGLPVPRMPTREGSRFDAQLAACLELRPAFLSFTFGMPSADAMRAIRDRGVYVMGTASTVREAIELEKAGMDAVIAQGSEAGGHRSTFAGAFESSMIGSMALIPQIADAVKIPVIGSGGIMDGRGIVAALALGASAVQMGTAFLTCTESGVPEAYRCAILDAAEEETRITRAFSGRPARGIANRFLREMEGQPILPFPLQNALTRPMRTEAKKQNRAEFLSLWAGQGLRMAKRQSAAELMARLAKEIEDTKGKLGAG